MSFTCHPAIDETQSYELVNAKVIMTLATGSCLYGDVILLMKT